MVYPKDHVLGVNSERAASRRRSREVSAEHSEVAGDREQREASGFVCRPRRLVAGIAAGLDDRDVHAAAQHVLGAVFGESGADSASLVVGVDTDDVDPAHAFVKGIQRDRGEPDRPSVGERHEDVSLLAQTARPDRLGLAGAPIGMQTEEDRVPKNFPNRVEYRCPRPQGERNHGVEVSFAELADLNRVLGHGAVPFYMSSTIVTGPSLTSSIRIVAPNLPVSTGKPSSRRVAQKLS